MCSNLWMAPYCLTNKNNTSIHMDKSVLTVYLCSQKELERKKEEEEAAKKPKKFVPNSNYKEKYEHLIGRESAKEAARKTQTNKQYGFGKYRANVLYYRTLNIHL